MKSFSIFVSLLAGVAFAVSQHAMLQDLGTALEGNSNLSKFLEMVKTYPDILLKLARQNGVTVLAPNNEAFRKAQYGETPIKKALQDKNVDAITNLMQYHILEGVREAEQLIPGQPAFIKTLLDNSTYSNVTGGQRIQNIKEGIASSKVLVVSGEGTRSTVDQTDIPFAGGLIQAIETFMLPPTSFVKTTERYSLRGFLGATYAAGKTDNYTYASDRTFFAPNNDAFQRLGAAITNKSIEELSHILDFHVLPEVVYSDEIIHGASFVTLNGDRITVAQSGNTRFVNSAQLVQLDVLVANGVIHIIDNVMNPQNVAVSPNPEIPVQTVVYPNATFTAGVPFTTAFPATTTSSSNEEKNRTSVITPTASFSSRSSSGQGAPAVQTGINAAGKVIMAVLGAALVL